MIKKRGFWRNALLKQSKTLPMLTYLNRMSAKGLHITKLGRFKNTFDEDKNVRYIYAICNPRTEDYYNEVGKWERVFEYKSLAFYRKRLPRDSVSIKKRNLRKKAMKEKLWLNDMLKEGLLLFGKVEDEYIFEHSGEAGKAEYFVDYISQNKNPDEYLYEKALSGFECISPSTDGITYYFVKREGQEVVKGLKKLRSENAVMKRRMFRSLFTFALITVSFITALVFAVKYNTLIIPCLIAGGALTAASLTVFIIFKCIYDREKRRLLEEEAKLSEFKKTAEGDGEPRNVGDGDLQIPEEILRKSVEQALQKNSEAVALKNPETSGSQIPAIQLPTKTDESDEWQYIDEDDEEEGVNGYQGTPYSQIGQIQNAYGQTGQSVGAQIPNTYGQTGQSVGAQIPNAYGQTGQNLGEQMPKGFYGQGAQSWQTSQGRGPSVPFAYVNMQPQTEGRQENPYTYSAHPQSTPVQYGQNISGQESQNINGQPYQNINGQPTQNMPRSAAMRTDTEKNTGISAEETEIERGRFLKYQLISSFFLLLSYTFGAVLGIINCVWWFIPEKRGSTLFLVLGIIVVLFLPVVVYNGIGAVRVLIKEMKNKKYKDF